MPHQKELPGFDGLPAGVRREPQPAVVNHAVLQPDDLIHRRFDLPFRGQLAYNIRRIQEASGFTVADVLSEPDQKFLRLCTQPEGPHNNPHWLTESEIKERLTGDRRVGNFRTQLFWITVRIWRRWAGGDRALEILKPELPLYRHMTKRYKTVDQLRDLSPGEFVRVCQHRRGADEFTALMRNIFPDYEPPVVKFRQEMTPQEAADDWLKNG